MSQLSKVDKKDLKKDLKDQKKEAIKRFKEGLSQQAQMKPKQARLEARQDLKDSKRQFKVTRKELQLTKAQLRATQKSGYSLTQKDIQTLKAKYRAANKSKLTAQADKRLYKKAVKNDPSLIHNQVRHESKLRTKQEIKYKTTAALREDDTIGEGIEKIHRANQMKLNMRQSLRATKGTVKFGVKITKGGYGLANRSYNLVRGKGFYRTPPQFTTRAQLMKKVRQSKRRVSAYTRNKQQQATTGVKRLAAKTKEIITQLVKLVAGNPLTWLILVGVIVISMILGAFSSNQFAIHQEEADLTDSWVYMTKLDAEHNDGSNTFYTQLDDVMFYMNHQHEDYRLNETTTFGKSYEDHLATLWEALNGKAPDYETTTMDKLLTDKKGKWFMDEDDYADYQEVVSEYGYQTLDGLLAFPYQTEELTVTRRFGHEGTKEKLNLFEGIEVTIINGTDITSPMDGKVSKVSSDNTLEIVLEEEAKLILEGVSTSRFKGGEVVKEGEYLGSAISETLAIKYFKYQTEEARWKAVNPAFYFPKVIYTQQTILGIDYEAGSLSPEIIALMPLFKEMMAEAGMPEKYLPVVLAVAMQESGGSVPDVMQSSESLGLPPNTLGTEDSIRQGVKYLWGNIQLVGQKLVDQDEKYLKTAVQAYNYGVGFISFSKINNYAYTQELANTFSVMMSGSVSGYGDSKYIPHVWRYLSTSKPAPGKGQFAYPLPERLNDVSGFDWRINEITNLPELHKGLDFAVNAGTPVFASEDAKVVRSSDVGDGYGINVVLIHNSGGYWTRYAHLSQATVSDGASVKRGQMIGKVGSTGQSTGPHLHYGTTRSWISV